MEEFSLASAQYANNPSAKNAAGHGASTFASLITHPTLGQRVRVLLAQHGKGVVHRVLANPIARQVVCGGGVCPTAKVLAVMLGQNIARFTGAALVIVPSFARIGYWIREWFFGRASGEKATIESAAALAELVGSLGGAAVGAPA